MKEKVTFSVPLSLLAGTHSATGNRNALKFSGKRDFISSCNGKFQKKFWVECQYQNDVYLADSAFLLSALLFFAWLHSLGFSPHGDSMAASRSRLTSHQLSTPDLLSPGIPAEGPGLNLTGPTWVMY